MKVSIIVGHTVNGKDKGAVAYNGVSESEYNYRVATLMKERGVHEVKIWLRDGTTYKKMGREIKEFNPDVHMELHFNSFSKAAYGCECLALEKDTASISFADLVTDMIHSIFESPERHGNGVLKIGVGGRGHLNLKMIKDMVRPSVPVVLIEPFFANVKTKESELLMNNPIAYAEAILYAVSRLQGGANRDVNAVRLAKSPANTIEMVKGLIKRGYGV